MNCNCADWIRSVLQMDTGSSPESDTLTPMERILKVIDFLFFIVCISLQV